METLNLLIDLATEVSVLVDFLSQPPISQEAANDTFEHLETRAAELREAAIKMEKIWEATPQALKAMLELEEPVAAFDAQVDDEDEYDPLAADPEFMAEHPKLFQLGKKEEDDEEPIA